MVTWGSPIWRAPHILPWLTHSSWGFVSLVFSLVPWWYTASSQTPSLLFWVVNPPSTIPSYGSTPKIHKQIIKILYQNHPISFIYLFTSWWAGGHQRSNVRWWFLTSENGHWITRFKAWSMEDHRLCARANEHCDLSIQQSFIMVLCSQVIFVSSIPIWEVHISEPCADKTVVGYPECTGTYTHTTSYNISIAYP